VGGQLKSRSLTSEEVAATINVRVETRLGALRELNDYLITAISLAVRQTIQSAKVGKAKAQRYL